MTNIWQQFKERFSKRAALKRFIKDQRFLADLPEDQVKKQLLAVGWKAGDVDLVFKEIKLEILEQESKRQIMAMDKERTFLIKEDKKKTQNIRGSDLLNLAFRIFKVKPGRTILTILGIGVSFGTIYFLVSLGYGFQQILLEQLSSEESLLSLDVASNTKALVLDDEVLGKFSKIPGVAEVDAAVIVPGQIDSGKLASEATFYAVSENYFQLSGLKAKYGKVFDSNSSEVVVTSAFLQAFNTTNPEDLIGKKMTVSFYIPKKVDDIEEIQVVPGDQTYTVVGVVENEVNNFVYMPLSRFPKNGLPYGTAKVLVKDSAQLEAVRAKITEMGFVTAAIADTIDQANKIFQGLQILMALFGMAALVVAVIGMINTMTIALLERIQEVGIMKVLGVANSDIKKLFLLEAAIMGFLGGLSGLGMGYLGSQGFNFGVGLLARYMGGQSVNLFYYPMWFTVAIAVFALVVGFGTGIMPSRKAANLQPLQALRYK